MKRLFVLATALGMLVAASAAQAAEMPRAERTDIVQEHNFDGTPAENPETIGRAMLVRRGHRLSAVASIRDLIPGGVYTFWWVVVQEDGTFPDDIHVASGSHAVVGDNGRATVAMYADRGDESITGFTPDGVNEITFDTLDDTINSVVRIEIAYHGQADDAGDDLDSWLYDFWTGTACPPETPNPNLQQPHCPVYYAATFS